MARRLIEFKDQEKKIQKHANKYNNGNFNESVRQLILLGLTQLAESKKK